jgi:uncharacterized protein with von Willebrand factor type A (vWA) domain
MFIVFFLKLRQYGVPVSISELFDLLTALSQQLVFADLDGFYQLARLCLVKDEALYDKFDRAFADYVQQLEHLDVVSQIPPEWLLADYIRQLTPEQKTQLQALGDLQTLLDTLQQRLREQQGRHQGGNKWIGTGGTSPFGAYGFNPAGIRIGQPSSGARRAVKVWDQREFKALDAQQIMTERSMQAALKPLRRFARTGAATELDVAQTIEATSKQAGWLDLRFVPERRNAIKLLLLFDVGGSMDDHIFLSQQLFYALRYEFKQLQCFYFHNCPYETLWRDPARRAQGTSLMDVIHTYGTDYKLIMVGDATMGPYEITQPGGSVEHWNERPGQYYLKALLDHYPKAVWLNPQSPSWWPQYHSIHIIQQLMDGRMYNLSVAGIQQAIKTLR